jgi:hypothetical protein
MGLDFTLAGASWPDEFAPDWWALRAAARELPPTLATIVDEAHQFSELGAETKEHVREMAISEVLWGIHQLQTALVDGSGDFSIVRTTEGHTVLLDGGVTGGPRPTETWYGSEALTITGLLGDPITPCGRHALPAPVPRAAQPLEDVAYPVPPTRLAVAELPLVPNWERGRTIASTRDLPLLERLEAVLDGTYSPTATVRRVGGRVLFIGDRALREGPASAIDAWERSGLLEALGGCALHDIRRQDRDAA